jgi:hypothetical protein
MGSARPIILAQLAPHDSIVGLAPTRRMGTDKRRIVYSDLHWVDFYLDEKSAIRTLEPGTGTPARFFRIPAGTLGTL